MRSRIVAALAMALVLMGVLATAADAQRWRERERDRGWMLLGEKEVGFGVDRDVIRIGQGEDWYRDRRFRTLHFIAEGNDVHMMSIRLVYFNGFGEDFRVDQLIRQGDDLPIDLRGERSFIRRIEMVYRSRPNFRGQAVIKVYGEPARFGMGRGLTGLTGRAPVPAVTGKSSAASRSPCSARTATRSASAGARAASRPFACTCVAQTSRCSISRSYMATASPTTFACAISFGPAIAPGRWT